MFDLFKLGSKLYVAFASQKFQIGIKAIIRSSGSFSPKKIGSSFKFEDIETETGTRFPIKVIVLNAFKLSVGTQIDSK